MRFLTFAISRTLGGVLIFSLTLSLWTLSVLTLNLLALNLPTFNLLSAYLQSVPDLVPSAFAQVPPSPAERSDYTGLHAAAGSGNTELLKKLLAQMTDPKQAVDARDSYERTPLHVATHASKPDAMRALVAAGANPNALERDRYDIVTIAAVANDVEVLKTALALGGKPDNITSRYDGTALIAAAHLGHHESVDLLIKAGAPINHVNNLGWNALIESVALGDGGERHQKTMALLLAAGADVQRADYQGARPIALARALGYGVMVKMLEAAERR
jgi:uncharacterized protein